MSETATDAPSEHAIRTHFGWAVAATMLCFLPLGLVAVGYSLSANSAVAAGDVARAERKARVARRWIVATVVVGLLVDLALLAAFVLLGAFSS